MELENNDINKDINNESEASDVNQDETKRKGKPFLIVLIAVVVLFGLSFVPWGKLTNNFLKQFNLFSDIFNLDSDTISTAEEFIDPLLEAEIAKMEAEDAQNRSAKITITQNDSKVQKSGNMALIEDYTSKNFGLSRFKLALAQRESRPVRVAIIGDSYIEGDIFSQDVRKLLQDEYGGNGVGYMYMSSDLTGFRRSISQSCSGWTAHDLRKGTPKFRTLPGEYFTGGNGATTTFKGVSSKPHLDSWNTTTILYVSPTSGTIDVAVNDVTKSYPVAASDSVQAIVINSRANTVKIVNHTPDISILGTWLNDNNGIYVDCMSLRGNSGITHKNIDADIARQMAKWIDYDLIIVEYGINALSPKQKNYESYGNIMLKVVETLRKAYPNASILMMGIGDRGEKIKGTMRSMSTAPDMVKTQRSVARTAGILFWDTREAMGGTDAIVDWRDKGWVNPDYIHLNAKGGEELARRFVKSLKQKIDE